MTKRVLSMLMALIMALSLCVPAFAADEPVSADEPATEVEAPAAEAEEIEAEEVEAEAEPVDEPAEAAVDEPETAAVDEPMLVALGVVTKEAHWELKKAVDAAEKVAADVAAGKFRLSNGSAVTIDATLVEKYAKDPEEADPFKTETDIDGKSFADTLAEAKVLLEGVDGKEVDVNVTTTSVQDAADALNDYVKAGEETALTTKIAGSGMDAAAIKNAVNTLSKAAYASVNDAKNALEIKWNGKDNVTTSGAWKKAYQANYLTKLQAAINAVLAYEKDTSKTYTEYKTVVYAVLDALALEAVASKPVSADMTRVNAVIAATPDEDDYVAADYVLQATDIYTASDGRLAKVTALKADPAAATVEFASTATLWGLNSAVTNLQNALIKPDKATIKFVSGSGSNGATAKVTFSVESVAGNTSTAEDDAKKMDGYEYGIAWRVKRGADEKWYDGATGTDYEPGDSVPTAVIKKLINGFDTQNCKAWVASDTPGVYLASGELKYLSDANFNEGDVVTVYILKNEGTKDAPSWQQVLMKDFKIGPTSDAPGEIKWPEIKSVTYTAATTAGVVAAFDPSTNSFFKDVKYDATKLTGGFASSAAETGAKLEIEFEAEFDISGQSEYDIWFVIKDPNGKVIYTDAAKRSDSENTKVSITIGTAKGNFDDALLKAGTYTVEMRACKADGKDDGIYDVEADGTFTIEPIAVWAQSGNIASVLAAAEALEPSDYKVNDTGKVQLSGSTDAAKLSDAFALIQKNIAGIRAVLNDATAGSTMTSHNLAVANKESDATSLGKLLTVIGYLEKLPADFNEMNGQLKLAIDAVGTPGTDFENEGTGKYTFDTRGRLQDAIKAAQAQLDLTATGALQSDVDAATAELKAALAGLVEIGEIDKSELEASIAAAEALNEDDYTPESWAALEDAIEAAKNVLADEDATQAQLTNAADKLNKAVAALVKRDLTTEDLEEAIAAAEAAIADPSKYTDESVLAVQDAITAAKALGDDATAAEIQEAIDKLDAAVKGLVPAEAEPELKEGWNLVDGEYYYCKDGKMVKSDWVKSKGLWYHMGADGTMDTGFIHIVDDWGDGWYYLEESNDKGTQGRMRTGW